MVPLLGGFVIVLSSSAPSILRVIGASLLVAFTSDALILDVCAGGWTVFTFVDPANLRGSISAILPNGILGGFLSHDPAFFASPAKLTRPRGRFAGCANNKPVNLLFASLPAPERTLFRVPSSWISTSLLAFNCLRLGLTPVSRFARVNSVVKSMFVVLVASKMESRREMRSVKAGAGHGVALVRRSMI